MRFRRTHTVRVDAIVIAALVLAGTAVFLLLPNPEGKSISADGGAVRVDGVWRPELPPIIERVEAPVVALRGPAYRISAPPAPEGNPYVLAFSIPAGLASAAATVFRYNASLAAWQAYPSVRAPDGWTISAEALSLPETLWGVGERPAVHRPLRGRVILGELLAAPPPGAVGYRAFDAAVDAQGNAVLFADPMGSGGCDGRFRVGNSRMRTSRDIPADGAVYRVLIDWQIGQGCPISEPLAWSEQNP